MNGKDLKTFVTGFFGSGNELQTPCLTDSFVPLYYFLLEPEYHAV